MPLPHTHGGGGLRRVFKQHEVAQPGSIRWAKSTFFISSPKVDSISQRFFDAVVEVVPKRSYMRFELHNGDQSLVGDHQQVPTFLRPIPTWQFGFLPPIDRRALKPRLLKQRSDEFSKSIKMPSAGHSASVAPILVADIAALTIGLQAACRPELFDRSPEAPFQVDEELIHSQILLDRIDGCRAEQPRRFR